MVGPSGDRRPALVAAAMSLLMLVLLAVPSMAGGPRPRGSVMTRDGLRSQPGHESEGEESREEILGIAYSFSGIATAPGIEVDSRPS